MKKEDIVLDFVYFQMNNCIWSFLDYVEDITADRPLRLSSNQSLNQTFCLYLKKNQNAPRSSEHPPVRGENVSESLGRIKGCKYKTSSWHLNGFPDGNNIGKPIVILYTYINRHAGKPEND